MTSKDGKIAQIQFKKSKSHYNLLQNENNLKSPTSAESKKPQQRYIKLSRKYLSQLKCKCLITLVSLLEGNDPSDGIGLRISRAIPLRILTNNLTKIYELYQKLYKNGDYTEDVFGHHEVEGFDSTKPSEYYEFIIENGFNIFILINIFLDQSKDRDDKEDDNELEEFMEKDHMKDQNLFGGVFKEFSKLGKSFVSGFGAITDITKKLTQSMKVDLDTQNELNKIQESLENKHLLKQAIIFFRNHTKHVEIIRDGALEKVYFPLLPYCKTLTREYKREFHENVNRASIKNKIAGLMEHSDETLKFMKYEEKLRLLFNKYRIIGVIASYGKLWEYCAFYINIILNAFIISSYSSKFGNRLNNPSLFMDPNIKGTQNIIYTLGCLNLTFSTLVVVFTLVKRVPLVTEHIWKGFHSLPLLKKLVKLFINLLYSLFYCLKDFYFSYYSLIIIMCILGLVIHPFLFAFQLFDLLRNDVLKNVVKAVTIPKVSIMLTLIVMILGEYYLSLIGYIFFQQHYGLGEGCISLLQCFLKTFDQTFKNNGGTGSYLIDPSYYEEIDTEGNPVITSGVYNISRFIFDNVLKIAIMLIIVNMLAGNQHY